MFKPFTVEEEKKTKLMLFYWRLLSKARVLKQLPIVGPKLTESNWFLNHLIDRCQHVDSECSLNISHWFLREPFWKWAIFYLVSLFKECDMKENMILWTVLENISNYPSHPLRFLKTHLFLLASSFLLTIFYYENGMEAYTSKLLLRLSERKWRTRLDLWQNDFPSCITDV